MKKKLSKVVAIDKDKCVNCHACITACPVKYCNDGSKEYMEINEDLCIGCGNCIRACTHDARYAIDDFEAFMEDIEKGEPMVAIAAPAVASCFPNQYLKFNGWLKKLGIEAVFDVSFGAELTVKSYIQYIKENNPKAIIAQPCPAIVTYIQIYQPELVPYLAPADSPMLHTIKMIKEFYPRFKHHEIMVVSPCLAKKREFEETGFGEYNITFKSFSKYLSNNKIDLSSLPEEDFLNKSAERAVLFSSPGGLMRTVEREVPGIYEKTRKIEGQEVIYNYLKKLPDMIERGLNPLLIDCLNCEMGCNGGPGTLNQEKSPDEIEYLVEIRKKEMQKRYKKQGFNSEKRGRMALNQNINAVWKPGLYYRSYANLSDNNEIKIPNSLQLDEIYKKMHKYSDEDIYNCSSCGYGSCEDMATAIFNGLNIPENCHFYKESTINKSLKEAEDLQEELREKHDVINNALKETKKIKELLEAKHKHNQQMALNLASTVNQMDKANESICKMAAELLSVSDKQNDEFKNLVKELDSFSRTAEKFYPIVDALNFTAERINLLSLNASIESARAGQYGKRFAVVATEIKELANNAQEEGNKISPYAKQIKNEFEKISTMILRATEQFEHTARLISEVTSATEEMSNATNNLNNEAQNLVNEEINNTKE